jgi:hypothetical protein
MCCRCVSLNVVGSFGPQPIAGPSRRVTRSMELAGAFRLGGDVDEAWRNGVATIVDAVASGNAGVRKGR